jgi:hypothetical protein
MCDAIRLQTGEQVAVVDIVFWRFATLEHAYPRVLAELRDHPDWH